MSLGDVHTLLAAYTLRTSGVFILGIRTPGAKIHDDVCYFFNDVPFSMFFQLHPYVIFKLHVLLLGTLLIDR